MIIVSVEDGSILSDGFGHGTATTHENRVYSANGFEEAGGFCNCKPCPKDVASKCLRCDSINNHFHPHQPMPNHYLMSPQLPLQILSKNINPGSSSSTSGIEDLESLEFRGDHYNPNGDHVEIPIGFDDHSSSPPARSSIPFSNSMPNTNGSEALWIASIMGTISIISVDRNSLSRNGMILLYTVAVLNIIAYFLCYFLPRIGDSTNLLPFPQVNKLIQGLFAGFTFLGALCLVFPDDYIWWAASISWLLWASCLLFQCFHSAGAE